ncbi:hypothetical protein [Motilimonas pumila]|uniref:PEGA domain-containing protein n=1 Tax=Motilimonas pumila TaxID=2303987 RepID=A0A418YF40_9GAMM|nr:hypothetical protein [Motilimonas pumila]RJG47745.1 hypothetical protein D1Z90_10100 [Motilimonas pumila]
MNTFDLLLLAGALCGVIMVAGGILLLYKGAISLSKTATPDAFTIAYKKELRISTQYPALGIFLIGLMFVFFSVVMGKPNINTLTVTGTTTGIDEPVFISIKTGTWSSGLSHQGELVETFHPRLDTLQIVVSAPGYDNHVKTIQVDTANKQADLGQITLTQKVSKASLLESKIVPLPNLDTLPDLNHSQFGAAR